MAPLSRHDRVVRLIAVRLERLAIAAERGDVARPELALHFEQASAATHHAVRLDLLSADEASSIWASARREHPGAFRQRHYSA